MAALRSVSSLTAAALLGGLLGAACAPQAQPRSLPPQSVTQTAPDPPPPSDPLVAAPEKDEPATVVIDPGVPEGEESSTLAEAAAAERERRKTAAQPTVVITDKNLRQHAAGGKITTGEAKPPSPATAALDEAARDEAHWRSRARQARQRWRDAADVIAELELEAADLRRQFYTVDDPYVRDGRIKPAWDLALERLAQAEREVVAAQEELGTVLEGGRQAGALPGWLREGIELEPAPPAPPARVHEPGEPVVIDEDGDGGARR
jgi:hypothetical protein